MDVRGKRLTILFHAYEGMCRERPPIRVEDIVEALELPFVDKGGRALAWRDQRTLLVYYAEYQDEIRVRAVSATRRRLAA